MRTVITLAEALSRAAFSTITRLDIQLVHKNEEEAYYSGRLWLADDDHSFFDIKEDGTITKGAM